MKILKYIAAICLLAPVAYAANPAFGDFNANQFSTSGNKIAIPSAAPFTNPVFRTAVKLDYALPTTTGPLSLLSISNAASGGTIMKIPDGTGALTNDGAGHFGYASIGGTTQGGVSTNSILQATNIIGIQDSICIPAGAFYSANLLTPSTNATFTTVTNLCEGWVMNDSITNEVRVRFALPFDWDAGTVKMELRALCTGTNSQANTQTNVVFAVAAATLPGQADVSSPTFGTAIWVTNRISDKAFVEGDAVTGPITVGNSPSGAKTILWQIQRLGAAAGDSLTNSSLIFTEARVFFTRNLTTTNSPASSP